MQQDTCSQPPFPRVIGGGGSSLQQDTTIGHMDLHPTLFMVVAGTTSDTSLLGEQDLSERVPFLAAYQGSKMFPLWKRAYPSLQGYDIAQAKISLNATHIVGYAQSAQSTTSFIIILRAIDGVLQRIISSQRLGKVNSIRKTILMQSDVVYIATSANGSNGKSQAVLLSLDVNSQGSPLFVRAFSGMAQATSVKWTQDAAQSAISEPLAGIFGASTLNINYFMQASILGQSANVFYSLTLSNATGQPQTTRVYYQEKSALNSYLFLADQFKGVMAVAELASVSTLQVASSGKLTNVVYLLRNLPDGSLLTGLQFKAATLLYSTYLVPSTLSVALVLTNTKNSTSTLLRLVTPQMGDYTAPRYGLFDADTNFFYASKGYKYSSKGSLQSSYIYISVVNDTCYDIPSIKVNSTVYDKKSGKLFAAATTLLVSADIVQGSTILAKNIIFQTLSLALTVDSTTLEQQDASVPIPESSMASLSSFCQLRNSSLIKSSYLNTMTFVNISTTQERQLHLYNSTKGGNQTFQITDFTVPSQCMQTPPFIYSMSLPSDIATPPFIRLDQSKGDLTMVNSTQASGVYEVIITGMLPNKQNVSTLVWLVYPTNQTLQNLKRVTIAESEVSIMWVNDDSLLRITIPLVQEEVAPTINNLTVQALLKRNLSAPLSTVVQYDLRAIVMTIAFKEPFSVSNSNDLDQVVINFKEDIFSRNGRAISLLEKGINITLEVPFHEIHDSRQLTDYQRYALVQTFSVILNVGGPLLYLGFNLDLSYMWNELQFLSLLSSVNLIRVNVSTPASDLSSIIFQIAQMQILPSQQIYERTLTFQEQEGFDAHSKQFRIMGFKQRNLIQGMGSHFILYNLWAALALTIGFIELVKWRLNRRVRPEDIENQSSASNNSRLSRLYTRVKNHLFCDFYFRVFLQPYLTIVIACLLNFCKLENQPSGETWSVIYVFPVFIAQIITPFLMGVAINNGKTPSLVQNVDVTSKFGKYLNVYQPARFFIVSFILVLMKGTIAGQLILVFIFITISLYFISKVRPHANDWYNSKELLNHSIILLYILCHLVLALTEVYPPWKVDPNADLRLGINRFLLALLAFAVATSLLLIVCTWIYGVFKYYRDKFMLEMKIEFTKTLTEYLDEYNSHRIDNDSSQRQLLQGHGSSHLQIFDEENQGPPSIVHVGQTARTAYPYETQELTNLLKQVACEADEDALPAEVSEQHEERVARKSIDQDQLPQQESEEPQMDLIGETITPIGQTPGFILHEDAKQIENIIQELSGGEDRLQGESEAINEAITTIEIKKNSTLNLNKGSFKEQTRTPGGPSSTQAKSIKSHKKSQKSRSIKQGSVKSKASPLKSAEVAEGSINDFVRDEDSIAEEVIPVVRVREQQNQEQVHMILNEPSHHNIASQYAETEEQPQRDCTPDQVFFSHRTTPYQENLAITKNDLEIEDISASRPLLKQLVAEQVMKPISDQVTLQQVMTPQQLGRNILGEDCSIERRYAELADLADQQKDSQSFFGTSQVIDNNSLPQDAVDGKILDGVREAVEDGEEEEEVIKQQPPQSNAFQKINIARIKNQEKSFNKSLMNLTLHNMNNSLDRGRQSVGRQSAGRNSAGKVSAERLSQTGRQYPRGLPQTYNQPSFTQYRNRSSDATIMQLANCKSQKCKDLIKVYLPNFNRDIERSRSHFKHSQINDSDLMSAGNTSRFSARTRQGGLDQQPRDNNQLFKIVDYEDGGSGGSVNLWKDFRNSSQGKRGHSRAERNKIPSTYQKNDIWGSRFKEDSLLQAMSQHQQQPADFTLHNKKAPPQVSQINLKTIQENTIEQSPRKQRSPQAPNSQQRTGQMNSARVFGNYAMEMKRSPRGPTKAKKQQGHNHANGECSIF